MGNTAGVNDGKPAVAEANILIGINILKIRTTLMQGHGGCRYVDHIEFSYQIKSEDTRDSAHDSVMRKQDRN
jgi:hypothetical protein